MARHFLTALERAGFAPETACRMRSFDALGDRARQVRVAARGARAAAALVARYDARERRDRPRLWFTYHLYHKAPDWIGPRLAAHLDAPYIVAEASHAHKQMTGPWRDGAIAAARAIAAADLIVSLNPDDDEGLRQLRPEAPILTIEPFLDVAPLAAARIARDRSRAALACRLGLDGADPWLVTVAMMRPGAKLASYRVLASALTAIRDRRWRLLVAGDGPARGEVEVALGPVADRCAFLGEIPRATIPDLLAAADLAIWPAVGEAFGMALLEAQAAGVAAIAGRRPGVAAIVADGETGVLAPEGDSAAFARATAALLDDRQRLERCGAAAAARARARHDVAAAGRRLAPALCALVDRRKELRCRAG